MSALGTPEAAATFGALDSARIADGEPLDSWSLRAMARSSNLLVSQGEPALSFVWSAELIETGEVPGGLSGFGHLHWVEFLPGPFTITKRAGMETYSVNVILAISGTDAAEIQVGTNATSGLSSRAVFGANNVFECVGNGSNGWQEFSLDGIPADISSSDRISFAIRGRSPIPVRVAPSGAYPTSGTVDQVTGGTSEISGLRQWSQAPNWPTASPNLATTGHAIKIEDSAGRDLWSPRSVIAMGRETVSGSGVTNDLVLYPGLDYAAQSRELHGANYSVIEIPRWQICNVAMWTEDRI